MATGMVQRADGSWYYEDTSPAHLTYDQWLAQQGTGPAATPPGPARVEPPVVQAEATPAPEQGPVQAKAFYAAQGQTYSPSSNPAPFPVDFGEAAVDEKKSSEETPPEEQPQQPKPGRQPRGGMSSPQGQPYTPPQFNYSFDPQGAGYGGVGAAGAKSVWGASYGGAGEDPYLKSMQNFANPFKEFFNKLPLNHF